MSAGTNPFQMLYGANYAANSLPLQPPAPVSAGSGMKMGNSNNLGTGTNHNGSNRSTSLQKASSSHVSPQHINNAVSSLAPNTTLPDGATYNGDLSKLAPGAPPPGGAAG